MPYRIRLTPKRRYFIRKTFPYERTEQTRDLGLIWGGGGEGVVCEAARTCPRGPHAFVVAFTVRRAGPAGYGAATHNTTQYKYSFRKDRSEECTRSHRVVHVSYMTGLTNLKLDRFSTGPTYRNPFPVKISPGETLHSE